jgi:hypothetical protein
MKSIAMGERFSIFFSTGGVGVRCMASGDFAVQPLLVMRIINGESCVVIAIGLVEVNR